MPFLKIFECMICSMLYVVSVMDPVLDLGNNNVRSSVRTRSGPVLFYIRNWTSLFHNMHNFEKYGLRRDEKKVNFQSLPT